MGMFALLQFRGKFSEIDRSFFWIKNYCSFEANFCEDFDVWSKCNSFYFFLVFEQKFQPGCQNNFTCVWSNILKKHVFLRTNDKIRLCWSFRPFPEKSSDINEEFFRQGCKEKLLRVQIKLFVTKACVFRENKICIYSSTLRKKFYFLKENLQSTLAKLHFKCSE